jgi:hypothetical protein
MAFNLKPVIEIAKKSAPYVKKGIVIAAPVILDHISKFIREKDSKATNKK